MDTYFPDIVVQGVARHLAAEACPCASLSLVSAAGVNSQWRRIFTDANAWQTDTTWMCLDSFEESRAALATAQRFKRASPAAKTAMFQSAARSFKGVSQLSLTGSSVGDAALFEAATHRSLKALKVRASAAVTDMGLAALVLQCPLLEELYLENLPSVIGTFIPALGDACPSLRVLHLDGLPALQWSLLKSAEASLPCLAHLRTLHLVSCNLTHDAHFVFPKLPQLHRLDCDGAPTILRVAAHFCPQIQEVAFTAVARLQVDEALAALFLFNSLQALHLTVRNLALNPEQLRMAGVLPVTQLCLDSFFYKQHPGINRICYSHIDNAGVRVLVESLCSRNSLHQGVRPFKLSLCGATSISHDAVSALLRLPILSELNIGGCIRISSMDRMRLVAKVKAGRELLEVGRRRLRC